MSCGEVTNLALSVCVLPEDDREVKMQFFLLPLFCYRQLKFRELAELFYQCELCKRQPGKKVQEALRIFVNTHLPKKSDDFFQLLRLMLPQASKAPLPSPKQSKAKQNTLWNREAVIWRLNANHPSVLALRL